MRRGAGRSRAARGLLALAAVLALSGAAAGLAAAERAQDGPLVATLDGGISPLALPRAHPAPVSVHLEGGLRSTDGATLPRIVRVQVGFPRQGIFSTRGLPACGARRIANATSRRALAACGGALVGSGSLDAQILLPGQEPFDVRARLLLFNGRGRGGRRVVLLHGYSADPPTVVVIPFVLRRGGPGRFATTLTAEVPGSLGPWPRLARFRMTLWRRYRSGGRERSYLSSRCPIPKRFTAGFASLANATYTLADGRELSVEIVRGCRAR